MQVHLSVAVTDPESDLGSGDIAAFSCFKLQQSGTVSSCFRMSRISHLSSAPDFEIRLKLSILIKAERPAPQSEAWVGTRGQAHQACYTEDGVEAQYHPRKRR